MAVSAYSCYSYCMTRNQDSVLLEASGLSKWYGKGEGRFRALDDVTVRISAGESVAIVGKSGSGKSTLMHLLALLDAPDAGAVFVDGRDAAVLRPREVNELRNRRFGFVFQQFFLTANTSVLDNVTLPLKIAGTPARERRARGLAALRTFGLEDKAKNRASDLSGGQKQRVVLTRALVGEPAVIFADEPTGNLDSATGRLVEEELFQLNRERGITLVIVTHDEDLAARCDRQILVRDGRIVDAMEVAQ
ncbi:ABC transporter ATP-binding protein [Microbacterium maritypicum]|uniref:ABC transporter ATP-binding protein n=1 Tax=Microbacterium maritypicum TaxID=33918 RepID=A0AAJ5VCJ9_MICMQ|nr:ABC transporter ATP-binding protein [Microbacterium liquefaciens]WEF21741.1 ABC transporter ATP-binding protein [Microbacterium liquefaciens]